jgi:23S rRNA pseudouridine1911/1915/1917 synthase
MNDTSDKESPTSCEIIAKETLVIVEHEGLRIDRYCFKAFEAFTSKNQARKALKRGEILVNGEIVETSRFVRLGDEIRFLGENLPQPKKPYMMELNIPYEDDFMAIVEKPSGIVVNGNKFRTLQNTLPANLKESSQPDRMPFPRPVHRIDAPTSGLVIIAKTRAAMASLGRLFENRLIEKRYIAIVIGRLEGEGSVDLDIEGRSALSHWSVLSNTRSLRSEWLTTVELSPITGRTHQLRVHMAHIGHPILGDGQYGKEGMILKHKGVFLRAKSLAFQHPLTGEPIEVDIGEPSKFESLRAREERRWGNYNPK